MRARTAVGAVGCAALAAAVAASAGGCASCLLEAGGYAWGEMPDLDMLVGDTVEIEVWRHFVPEECQGPGLDSRFPEGWASGPFAAEWSDSAAVAVSVGDDYPYHLTVAALGAADTVRVYVWQPWLMGDRRPGPLYPNRYHEFQVRVRPPPAGR